METNDLITEFKTIPEVKQKFLNGINKLGFPLEFKIRRRLKEKGYNSVQEGFFTAFENNKEITKSFDISAYKDRKGEILKELTIDLSLQLIGDCKYSSDNNKFLFAIPDTSNPANKLFIGPILTNFQSANYGVYRNSEVASIFLEKYGDLFLASDIKDTSKEHIINGKEEKDNKILEYERIYNIVENTILPATKEKFIRWRTFSYQDYFSNLEGLNTNMPTLDFVNLQEKRYYSGKLLIPFIVTSKQIIKPIVNENGEIVDIEEIGFVFYEHSVLNPDNYLEILDKCYDVGVFVCNERYFDNFLDYIENIFNKLFNEITGNLDKHPFRLIEDFDAIKKQNEEIKKIRKTK